MCIVASAFIAASLRGPGVLCPITALQACTPNAFAPLSLVDCFAAQDVSEGQASLSFNQTAPIKHCVSAITIPPSHNLPALNLMFLSMCFTDAFRTLPPFDSHLSDAYIAQRALLLLCWQCSTPLLLAFIPYGSQIVNGSSVFLFSLQLIQQHPHAQPITTADNLLPVQRANRTQMGGREQHQRRLLDGAGAALAQLETKGNFGSVVAKLCAGMHRRAV